MLPEPVTGGMVMSMKPLSKVLLPFVAAVPILLTSCVVVEPVPYYRPRAVYAPGFYPGLPPGYVGEYYWHGGRCYYGGRHEVGRFYWNGRYYDHRYYHNGRYLYGGELRRGGEREHHHSEHRHYDRY